MSYITSLRNARMNLVRDAIAGGTLYICSGTKPASPAVPSTTAVLSQHAVPAIIADAEAGALTVAGIGTDAQANNTGTPGYAAIAAPDGSIVACFSAAELAMTLTLPTGDTQIVAGREVRVQSLVLAEGNP